jgi:hypothetical protein
MSPASDLSRRKEAQRKARAERSAAALRDNLRRRKDQTRARAGGEASPADPRPGLSGAPLSSTTDRHGGTTAD